MAEGYQSKIVLNCGLKPLNPTQCGMQICKPSYSFGPFTRGFWLLHFVVSGKGTFTNGKNTYEIKENEMFIIRPYEVTSYTADAEEPWTYIWIGFYSELPIPLPLVMNDVLSAPYLKDIFLSVANTSKFEGTEGNESFEHYLCGAIWQIFGLLMRGNEKTHVTAEGYVNAALNIMKYEYHTAVTVSEIASRLHIARTYFSEIFKIRMGVSPKKYLEELRMNKAASLLIKHNVSISATANSVGYPDVFAFSRAFKRYFSYSPTEYIKKYRTQGRHTN